MPRKGYEKFDLNDVGELYIIQKLSASAIGKQKGTSAVTILNALKRRGIARRTQEEVQTLQPKHPFTKEHKRRISRAVKNWHNSLTDEQKRKRSEKLREWYRTHISPWKGHHHTEEAKGVIARTHRGKPKSDTAKRKISLGVKRLWQDPVHVARMSASRRKMWQDPEYVTMIMKARNVKPNKAELELFSIIETICPNQFKYNGDFSQKVMLNGLVPDFLNVNGKKQVIEMFGRYFHNPNLRKGLKWHRIEVGRIAAYHEIGWDCLVIWDHELKNINAVSEKVKAFVGE